MPTDTELRSRKFADEWSALCRHHKAVGWLQICGECAERELNARILAATLAERERWKMLLQEHTGSCGQTDCLCGVHPADLIPPEATCSTCGGSRKTLPVVYGDKAEPCPDCRKDATT